MSSYIELQISDVVGSGTDTTTPKIRIELPLDALTIYSVLEDLVKPALLAAGFAPSSVEDIVFAQKGMEKP